MATNRRRSTRTTRSSRGTRAANVRSTAVQPASDGEQVANTPTGIAAVDWNREYSYIIRDLRQLGVVTLVLTAVLLIVGFLI